MKKCTGCGRYHGACICHRLARHHRAAQEARGHPTTCGQRFQKSGGTCHATTPCHRDHSRY